MPDSAIGTVATQLMASEPFGAAPGNYEALLALVRVGVDRLAWGSMLYRCSTCGFEWDVYLALGIEGPSALREEGLYVAAPFTTKCPAWPGMTVCAGAMSHTEWPKDRNLGLALPPDDAPRFVLPNGMTRGNHGSRLEIPEPALIRARRWHNEPEGSDA